MGKGTKRRPPAEDVPLSEPYNMKTLSAPALSGTLLWIFVRLVLQTPLIHLVIGKLLRDSGIPQQLDPECPENPCKSNPCDITGSPSLETPVTSETDARVFVADPKCARPPAVAGCPRVVDFFSAYETGRTTPVEVAERVIAFLLAHEERLKSKGAKHTSLLTFWDPSLVREQAERSATRWREGRPLSMLDGVLVAIKDEIDAVPFPTVGGTKWMRGVRRVDKDAAVVVALRRAGAVILGKATQQEMGIDTRGINPWYGTADNPCKEGRVTGGSSSACAALIALGCCPVAIGTDGGGSIRVPSSLCGGSGLKPTHRLLDPSGVLPIAPSLGVVGPMAGSVEDVAVCLSALAPAMRERVPMPDLGVLEGRRGRAWRGARVGLCRGWAEHCDAEGRRVWERAVRKAEEMGGQVVEIGVPELEAMRVAATVIFASESSAFLEQECGGLDKWISQLDGNTAAALLCARAGRFSGTKHERALQIRERAMSHFRRVFAECDVLLTPMNPIPAPRRPPNADWFGSSNLGETGTLMRFAFPANLVGLPAVTLNGGFSQEEGLPMGVQIMGPHWSDSRLLFFGAALEVALADDVLKERPESFKPACEALP